MREPRTQHKVKNILRRVCCDVVNSVILFFAKMNEKNKFFAKNLSIVLTYPCVQAVNKTSSPCCPKFVTLVICLTINLWPLTRLSLQL